MPDPIIMGVDPSLTCTGVAVVQGDEAIVLDKLKPDLKDEADNPIEAWDRAEQLAELILETWKEHVQPRVNRPRTMGGEDTYCVLEMPIATTEHKGNRHRERATGLADYGLCVGVVWNWLSYRLLDVGSEGKLIPVRANVWTGKRSKASNQNAMRALYPVYNDVVRNNRDPGGDVGDALGLVEWWKGELSRKAEVRNA